MSALEESITQVGDEPGKKTIPVWLIGAAVVVLVLIVLSIGSEDEEKDDTSGVNFTNEDYKVKKTPSPAMPKPAPAPRPKRSQLPERNANPVIDLSNQASPEEKLAARKAKELAEKRLRAPLVLVSKRQTSPDDGSPSIRNEASQRMAELQRNTQDALQNLAAGSNKSAINPASLKTADVENVDAGFVSDRSYKLLQGKIIPAVLETAINSDLPGMLRAIVSDSVYSEDGNVLLVPKGSRLIGEYQSGTQRGQSRVFVIWSRMVRPDGIDIKMDSPGTDALGRAGLTGFVDTHFLERFGSSTLLSLVGSYAQQESQNGNQREALANSFNKSSEIALEDSINIAPTIHINQGERINVFVAKDLNFKQAVEYAQRVNKL